MPRHVVHRPHLAGKALHRVAIGAIRRDLEVEHRVRKATPGGKRLAQRRVIGQLHDAIVIAAQVELALRANHAAALDTAQLRLLDLEITGQNRADGRDGDFEARAHVGCSAHDLRRLGTIAEVDGRHVHVIAIRVGLAGLDQTDPHALEICPQGFDAFDAGSGQVEPVAEILQGIGYLDHRIEPFQ